MASEIRVNKIENRSGLGTVTFADTGVDLAGIVTATTFSGSGASLTSLPAAQLSGALPAISAASLTNVPAANVVGVHTSLTVTNATTTGSAVVGGGVTISESGIEASGIGITCANINGTQIGGRRNLVINGAMLVAQRGTSSTDSGYATVDRNKYSHSGTDEAPTQAQVDLSSSDTPYTLGFRKAYKITNGNQTSGAGADDYIKFQHNVEAQNVNASGWNFTSSSSFITLSFWCKSSVAQSFQAYFETADTTKQAYVFETGSLSADTWTKIVKTIPGNSNSTINNDNGRGVTINISMFYGTNKTGSNTLNQWKEYNSSNLHAASATTWYTTNDATFEITGLQLEVGPQATAFEHRSFGEELRLCERYCETIFQGESNGAYMNNSVAYGTNQMYSIIRFRTPKRATDPTLVQSTGTDYYVLYRAGGSTTATGFTAANWPNTHGSAIYNSMTCTSGDAGLLGSNNANALVLFTSEL